MTEPPNPALQLTGGFGRFASSPAAAECPYRWAAEAATWNT
jgi:hypothetical protein